MTKCKDHPLAPHGFDRNGSHMEDDYVCECKYWEPPEWYTKLDKDTYLVRESDEYELYYIWIKGKMIYLGKEDLEECLGIEEET